MGSGAHPHAPVRVVVLRVVGRRSPGVRERRYRRGVLGTSSLSSPKREEKEGEGEEGGGGSSGGSGCSAAPVDSLMVGKMVARSCDDCSCDA